MTTTRPFHTFVIGDAYRDGSERDDENTFLYLDEAGTCEVVFDLRKNAKLQRNHCIEQVIGRNMDGSRADFSTRTMLIVSSASCTLFFRWAQRDKNAFSLHVSASTAGDVTNLSRENGTKRTRVGVEVGFGILSESTILAVLSSTWNFEKSPLCYGWSDLGEV